MANSNSVCKVNKIPETAAYQVLQALYVAKQKLMRFVLLKTVTASERVKK